MIPNTALSKESKRTRADGDFMACVKCNQKKSKMDYIFGLIAKLQTRNVSIAEAAITEVLNKPNEQARIAKMLSTAKFNGIEYKMNMPCTASDLDEYFTFLAKGQYFKQFKKTLNTTLYMVDFKLIDKDMLEGISRLYRQRHDSEPLDDLLNNINLEILADGECIIIPAGKSNVIFFQGSIGVKLEVVRRTNRNMKNKREYLKTFAGFKR